MKPEDKIQEIINSIDAGRKNSINDFFLNTIKNEFITFHGNIFIPRISVKELHYDISVNLVTELVNFIPEFFRGHTFLVIRRPASDLHSLQFIKRLKGKLIDFVHFFKLDLRFGGDSYNIVEKGSTEFYPSYNSNRIYYKSKLVPCKGEDKDTDDFNPIRLYDSIHVEVEQDFHAYAVFDDINARGIAKEIYQKINLSIFSISQELYPFIAYDYFTSCFNVLKPDEKELNQTVSIFEPLFLYIYSKYKNVNEIASPDAINEKFSDSLSADGNGLSLKNDYLKEMEGYFKKFSIIRDDELAIKGWWRIDIAG